ncbi:MAG: hypothetical protein ACLFR5_00060 [Halobacteriales archaeon]
MKWVVVAFLIFAVVASGAFFATEPGIGAGDEVVVEAGEASVLDLSVRNTGTVHATVVGVDERKGPRLRLPSGSPTSSATAAVPASGEVKPRLIVEAPEDVEPGEYTVRLEAWRLPNRLGDRTVTEVTVVVEEP